MVDADLGSVKPCPMCGFHLDTPNHWYGCQEGRYEAAKADPLASIILTALYDQDAATYNGNAGDIGGRALSAAAKIRESLADVRATR